MNKDAVSSIETGAKTAIDLFKAWCNSLVYISQSFFLLFLRLRLSDHFSEDTLQR